MKAGKGTNGYIGRRKMLSALWTICIVLVSLGLFFIGWYLKGTTRNLLTVISVLGVLPAAKSLVACIVLFPYRSLEEDVYRRFIEAAGGSGKLYSDLVFTSEKNVMHLDALYINGTELVGYAERMKPKEKENVLAYFTESLKKRGCSVHMHIFERAAEMTARIGDLSGESPEIPEEITAFVRMILV